MTDEEKTAFLQVIVEFSSKLESVLSAQLKMLEINSALLEKAYEIADKSDANMALTPLIERALGLLILPGAPAGSEAH